MSTLRAVLVGYGWWGRKMAALVADNAQSIEILVVVEPVETARDEAHKAGFEVVADFDEALSRSNIDAVILATPHKFHTQQIAAAAAAGKHIFCEKPLALTASEAAASVALCKEKGLVLGIGHERRFEPAMAQLLADIKSGELGRIVQIEANFSHDKFVSLAADNWRLDPKSAPLAGMTATGIHLTDLAIAILGQPKSVSVYCDQLVSEIPQGDTFGAQITFEAGGNAYIAASLGVPFVSRFAVFGSKGWVEIRDKTHVEAPTGWVVLRSDADTGAMTIEEIGPAEAVLSNLETFANAVLGNSSYPIPTGDMITNTALLEAMGKSAVSGQSQAV